MGDLDRRRVLGGLGMAVAALAPRIGAAEAVPVIRIGVLKFGTVSWMLDVLRRHDLDRAERVRIEILELATNQATQIALQAGRVDVVVGDLLWVARQRASGADWAFVPYSTALGAVVTPEPSPLRTIEDLAGRRLGIAGTPLDKSWLLLRLLSIRRAGRDLDRLAEKSFGAPPLIAEQLAAGRLDAVLTYWQFAARLEARGARRLIGMDEVMRELGVDEPVALVGYIVSERWAAANRTGFKAFLAATGRAEAILASSDGEWRAIAGLTGAADEAELGRLREAFRAGIPKPQTGPGAAERLYELLAGIGGEALAGSSPTLPAGTFLDGFRS